MLPNGITAVSPRKWSTRTDSIGLQNRQPADAKATCANAADQSVNELEQNGAIGIQSALQVNHPAKRTDDNADSQPSQDLLRKDRHDERSLEQPVE